MVNQITDNLVEDYNPNRINPTSTNNEYNQASNQVSLITSPPQLDQHSINNNTSLQSTSYQTAATTSYSTYQTIPYSNYFYYPNQTQQFNDSQFHNCNQLIRRNSNYDQSTDSEQYLINSYYELSDHLTNLDPTAVTTVQPAPTTTNYQTNLQEQQFIENYQNLNHNSNLQANNHNYIYENYYTDYLNNRDQFNSIILFDSSIFKRIREKIFKNLPCMLFVLIPIFFATILILVFIRQINKTDKTDKDDLHQYAIYAFIIFSVAFIFPFALFFFIVVVNKIIKKYNKLFNPNFINNEFGDLLNANSIDPNLFNPQLVSASPPTVTTAQYDQHTIDHQTSNLFNQIDLQNQLQTNHLLLSNSQLLHNNQLMHNNQDNQQQISTLNVNQLQYSNNRQLINEMIEEFDHMNQLDQERTLLRMNSIQRRQRLIRQNAFENVFECPTLQPENLSELLANEDKLPNYDEALLMPKSDNEQKKKENDKVNILDRSLQSNFVNLNDDVNNEDVNNDDDNLNSSQANNELTNLNQIELRNNLENRRRSSNGSSIQTEPPAYSSLYPFDQANQKEENDKSDGSA